jgi:hypothetical protein
MMLPGAAALHRDIERKAFLNVNEHSNIVCGSAHPVSFLCVDLNIQYNSCVGDYVALQTQLMPPGAAALHRGIGGRPP